MSEATTELKRLPDNQVKRVTYLTSSLAENELGCRLAHPRKVSRDYRNPVKQKSLYRRRVQPLPQNRLPNRTDESRLGYR